MFSRKTKEVKVGRVIIGGPHPIAVQSMTKTKTADAAAALNQIEQLEQAGCQIVRLAIPDKQAAETFKEIRARTRVPLVADIHFNHELAILAIEGGADKVRINPGNIGDRNKVKQIVEAARQRGIPIRIGVNSGSLEKDLLKKYGHPTSEALVESALRHIEFMEKLNFHNLVVSIKSASVPVTVAAYQKLAENTDYPLHIGITESGIPKTGIIRSAVGIGILLYQGIGSTLRVSLTADPVEEVRVGYEILESLELANQGVKIIACPTCGRTEVDLISIVDKVEVSTRHIKTPVIVAIMGCSVNGPGEALEADVGLAAGKGVGLIFRSGEVVRKVSEAKMVEALVDEIESVAKGDKT
jgi:(E)-4-hydroxy-3-methylbut-2-enyl-diphosphate synthase